MTSSDKTDIPTFRAVVLDCPDPGELAGFYQSLLQWPLDPESDADWVTLQSEGGIRISFQRAPEFHPPQWPSPEYPQQVHLDFAVNDMDVAHERALKLGARLLDGQAWSLRDFGFMRTQLVIRSASARCSDAYPQSSY